MNTTDAEVCGLDNALLRDDVFAGLARVEADHEDIDVDGTVTVRVTSCITADFGESFASAFVSVVGRRTDRTCEASCGSGFCGTEVGFAVLAANSAAGPWIRVDEYYGDVESTEHLLSVEAPFRFVSVCRGGAATVRGHVELDSVAVVRR
jgi:hypothetical protein